MVRLTRALDHPVTTRLFQAAAIASLVVAGYAGLDARELSRCQAAYNEQLNAHLAARFATAADERRREQQVIEQLGTTVDELVDPARTREQRATSLEDLDHALERYENQSRTSEQERRANPLPQAPDKTCG